MRNTCCVNASPGTIDAGIRVQTVDLFWSKPSIGDLCDCVQVPYFFGESDW